MRWRLTSIDPSCAAAFVAFAAATSLLAADYEPPVTRSAAQMLPPALTGGPRFKVQDAVPPDGFMPQFTIESDFGQFVACGHEMLAVRVQEIAALDRMAEISRSEAFASAMARSAKSTGAAVANAATHPVETAAGIPKGVGRLLKGAGKSAKKAGAAVAEGVAEDDDDGAATPDGSGHETAPAAMTIVGASKAKRAIAREFKVDPYSTNGALQKKLDELAMATSAGGFAMKVVNPVALVSTVASVNSLVWDTPAPDLQELNDKKLAKLGVSARTRKTFFSNPFFTPTQQTGFVGALSELRGVSGADAAVAFAAHQARSEDDARFLRRAAELLAAYQRRTGPLASLELRRLLLAARARSGAFVVPAPVDWLTWTEQVHSFSVEPIEGVTSREMLLSGQASSRALDELRRRGWSVRQRVLGTEAN